MAFDEREKLTGFLEGLLIGGAIASVFTLLYAPKSGKKLRRDIQKRTNDLSGEVVDKYKDLQKKAENLLSETEKRIQKIISEGESVLSDLTKKVKK